MGKSKITRVYLRAFEPEDYKLINQWRKDPGVNNNLAGNKYFVSAEREKKWVESKCLNDGNEIYLAICLKETNEFIGYSAIKNIDWHNRKAEWGSILIGSENNRSKGYAKEAAILTIKHIFEELGMNRCYGCCLKEHPITNKFLVSLGFKPEGIYREAVYKGKCFMDIAFYSLLKKEFDDLSIIYDKW